MFKIVLAVARNPCAVTSFFECPIRRTAELKVFSDNLLRLELSFGKISSTPSISIQLLSDVAKIEFLEVSVGKVGLRPCGPTGTDKLARTLGDTITRWAKGDLTEDVKAILDFVEKGGFWLKITNSRYQSSTHR